MITVNDVWVKFFENAVPEGRYLFRLNPYHIFTSSGRPVPNRIAAYRWYGNSGTNLMWSDYRLIVRTAWSEYYAFASTPEEVIQANQAIWRLNHNQPDLMVLANTLNLPVKAPVGSVDFPMTIANLGEADSRPARLAMLAEQGVLARADIPLLKPGEQVTITMRLEGRLKSAQFQIEYAESGYKDFDSSNDALDLMLWTEADYDKARRLVPNPPPVPPEPKITMRPTPNDAFPPWVAGQLPAGAKAIGDWLWEPTPTFNVLRSHTASTTEGRVLHYFIRAADRLPLAPGDNLVQYVYLDTQSPPQQILLQLFVEGSKEGQAVYWGGDEDLLQVGSEAAKRLGDLPEPGKWVRLRVPVEMFGVRNAWINGLLFGQYEGRAYWGPTSKSVSRLDQTSEVMVVSEK